MAPELSAGRPIVSRKMRWSWTLISPGMTQRSLASSSCKPARSGRLSSSKPITSSIAPSAMMIALFWLGGVAVPSKSQPHFSSTFIRRSATQEPPRLTSWVVDLSYQLRRSILAVQRLFRDDAMRGPHAMAIVGNAAFQYDVWPQWGELPNGWRLGDVAD